MSAGTDRKVVLVTRKTRLDELVARYHSIAQARFYLEHLGADFADYLREHETYLKAKESALAVIARFQRRQVTDRHFLPNFLFGPDDIMIALGQDGLVANTMKYLDGQPLVGVNPIPPATMASCFPSRHAISPSCCPQWRKTSGMPSR